MTTPKQRILEIIADDVECLLKCDKVPNRVLANNERLAYYLAKLEFSVTVLKELNQ